VRDAVSTARRVSYSTQQGFPWCSITSLPSGASPANLPITLTVHSVSWF